MQARSAGDGGGVDGHPGGRVEAGALKSSKSTKPDRSERRKPRSEFSRDVLKSSVSRFIAPQTDDLSDGDFAFAFPSRVQPPPPDELRFSRSHPSRGSQLDSDLGPEEIFPEKHSFWDASHPQDHHHPEQEHQGSRDFPDGMDEFLEIQRRNENRSGGSEGAENASIGSTPASAGSPPFPLFFSDGFSPHLQSHEQQLPEDFLSHRNQRLREGKDHHRIPSAKPRSQGHASDLSVRTLSSRIRRPTRGNDEWMDE